MSATLAIFVILYVSVCFCLIKYRSNIAEFLAETRPIIALQKYLKETRPLRAYCKKIRNNLIEKINLEEFPLELRELQDFATALMQNHSATEIRLGANFMLALKYNLHKNSPLHKPHLDSPLLIKALLRHPSVTHLSLMLIPVELSHLCLQYKVMEVLFNLIQCNKRITSLKISGMLTPDDAPLEVFLLSLEENHSLTALDCSGLQSYLAMRRSRGAMMRSYEQSTDTLKQALIALVASNRTLTTIKFDDTLAKEMGKSFLTEVNDRLAENQHRLLATETESFFLGFLPRLGAESSIQNFLRHPDFDPNLISLIFSIHGKALFGKPETAFRMKLSEKEAVEPDEKEAVEKECSGETSKHDARSSSTTSTLTVRRPKNSDSVKL